jgi:hypothetical protein
MQNRKIINRYLGEHGLSTLDDPQGLVAQLGFLIEDDQHFKQVINRCDPKHRRDLYEALRPHLSFTPRALDVYIAELGMEAEIQQLPRLDEEGRFVPFRVQDIRVSSDREEDELRSSIREFVEAAITQHHLVLTCRSCTRTETFHGGRRVDAIQKARQAGWTYGLDATGGGYEICPECPASSRN